ncbi:helix-turn-helix domain-containing protein [Rhodococcus oxybenzonivorans]|uniref:helix-turn-helix domain-containing protein n=1 Tax=Rhodococcus oxybenzonivorans TaxID=1990687 RepID=UPI000D69CBB9|nr:helix-turn-helix domain-containing protein [Rhodococcus oxybenzonivorans]
MLSLPERWLTLDEAARLVGRTPRTINSWAAAGHIRVRRTGSGRRFEFNELLDARDAARARREFGNWKPGPGRPPHPARPQIRTLLAEGQKPVDIAQQLNCSAYLVYRVRRELKGTT